MYAPYKCVSLDSQKFWINNNKSQCFQTINYIGNNSRKLTEKISRWEGRLEDTAGGSLPFKCRLNYTLTETRDTLSQWGGKWEPNQTKVSILFKNDFHFWWCLS